MNFLKKIIRSLKGSQLVEKILIGAFSVSAGGAVIVYGATVVKNSTSAEVDQDDISGRTYGYNQRVQYGDFSTIGDWNYLGGTLTINNNEATFTLNKTADYYTGIAKYFNPPRAITGHKYFLTADVKTVTAGLTLALRQNNNYLHFSSTTTYQTLSWIHEGTSQGTQYFMVLCQSGNSGEVVNIKNCMCIDLTDWYGSGNEPSLEIFRAKFSRSYYPYQTEPSDKTVQEINALGVD